MASWALLTLLLAAPLATCNAWWNRQVPARDLPELAPTARPRINPHYGANATVPTITRPVATLSSVPQPDCTVVIPRAGLDWWYSQTYDYASSTYQILVTEPGNGQAPYGTAYTLYGVNASPINVTASLASPTRELVGALVTINGTLTSITTLSPSGTPTPIAPHTTVYTRSSVNPLPTSSAYDNPNGTYRLDLPPYAYKTLGPVQTTLAEAESSTAPTTITSATPFLRFTDFQIVSRVTRAVASGSAETVTITSTYNLTSPIGYALAGRTNLDGVLSASGTIPPDFTNALGLKSSCVLSSWYAEPTVIVVIEIIYDYVVVLAAHTEVSQSQLDIPGASHAPSSGQMPLHCLGAQCTVTFATGHIELSQTTLDVPSSFVIPAPTQPQPSPTVVLNSVPRRQQTIDGVSIAPSTPAPTVPTPNPAPNPEQASSELSALLSVLSRLGSLTTTPVDESTTSPALSEQMSSAAQPTAPAPDVSLEQPSATPSPALATPSSTSSTLVLETVSDTPTGIAGQSTNGQAQASPSVTVAVQATGSSSLLVIPSNVVLLVLAIVLSMNF